MSRDRREIPWLEVLASPLAGPNLALVNANGVLELRKGSPRNTSRPPQGQPTSRTASGTC